MPIWLRRLLKEFHLFQEEIIDIDNKSTQALAKNLLYYEQSKHIDTRYYFIREYITQKEVELKFVVNIFTKLLKFKDFEDYWQASKLANFF